MMMIFSLMLCYLGCTNPSQNMSKSAETLASLGVKKLIGNNWPEFEVSIKPLLRVQQVWPIVAGNSTRPTAITAAQTAAGITLDSLQKTYDALDDKAVGLIALYVDVAIQIVLESITEAKDDAGNVIDQALSKTHWDYLKRTHGLVGMASIYAEFKQLQLIKIHTSASKDPKEKLADFQAGFQYLTGNKLPLPESLQSMMMLSSLPKEWSSFETAILASTPINNLTPTLVSSLILEEFRRKFGTKSPFHKKKETNFVDSRVDITV